MEKQMKAAGIKISVCMGIVMSFFLSLTGTLSSGHFTIVGFLISFLVSTVISIIIRLIVPMGKINMSIEKKMGCAPGDLKVKLVESLISNLIYTPVMTLAMVTLAYITVMRQSNGMAQLLFLPMFLKSLVICFIVGYILIFIFAPFFAKLFIPKR